MIFSFPCSIHHATVCDASGNSIPGQAQQGHTCPAVLGGHAILGWDPKPTEIIGKGPVDLSGSLDQTLSPCFY